MNNGNETKSCYDVNIVGFDASSADALIETLCQQIEGLTREGAQDMLLHLPVNIAHGVEAELALLVVYILEKAGAQVHVKHKDAAIDRTLM